MNELLPYSPLDITLKDVGDGLNELIGLMMAIAAEARRIGMDRFGAYRVEVVEFGMRFRIEVCLGQDCGVKDAQFSGHGVWY